MFTTVSVMSWDSYIENLKGQCAQSADLAVIIGLDGSIWTTPANGSHLAITAAEAATIAGVFKSNDFTQFQANGVHIGGVKYTYLRVEDDKLVMAKKKDSGAISMQKSKGAVVIAHVSEGAQQGNVNKGVGVIADYLEGLGY